MLPTDPDPPVRVVSVILANRVQWLSADQKNPSPVVHVLIAQTWVIPSGSRGGIVGVGAPARHRRSVTSNGAVVKPGRMMKRCRCSAFDRRSLSRFLTSLGC